MQLRNPTALWFLVTGFAALAPSAVEAQATVVVVVQLSEGGAGDAEVTLTSEDGGASHRCTTRGGTCRMPSVGAGMYVVTARPTGDGRAPLPRRVPVTPSGDMEIRVRLR